MKKYTRGETCFVEYLIPGDIIKNELTIARRNYTIKPGIDSWVHKAIIRRVLHDCCGMSLQDYYDKYFLDGDRPKCAYCGKELEFHGICEGYSRHKNNKGEVCCCREHATLLKHRNIVNFGLRNKETLAKTAKSDFINRNKKTGKEIAYFYIANNEKIGITTSPKERFRYSLIDNTHKGYEKSCNEKFDLLLKGSLEEIAEFEYNIKKDILNFRETIENESEM